jgi:hypothetical protein
MADIMNEKKIFIVNLSKGRIGEANSMLLGALVVTKLYLAAMERVNIPEEQREDFFLYVDEFQNFATESFASILSEARKYRLCLTLAHQYILQLEEEVAAAIFGNVGTIITFRIGAEDSEYLEKEFAPVFVSEDFVNLTKYSIYVKLMIDGIAGRPFSATTLPALPKPEENYKEEIIKYSRQRYAQERSIVEDQISQWVGELDENAAKREEGKVRAISLSQIMKNAPIPFSPNKKKDKDKKTPDINEVNEALDKALEKKDELEDKKENGFLKPGDNLKL